VKLQITQYEVLKTCLR